MCGNPSPGSGDIDAHNPWFAPSWCQTAPRSASGSILTPIVVSRPVEAASQTIDVLKEIGRNVPPQRIEYDPHALASCKLRRWHEIRIARHKNDHVSLALQRDRCDVESDSHIHTLLAQSGRELAIGKIADCNAASRQVLLRPFPQEPGTTRIPPDFTQAYGKIGLAVQGFEEPLLTEWFPEPVPEQA